MKLILGCFVLMVAGFSAAAQFAVINDPDGYTNVREGKGVNTKIVGRFTSDDIFMYSYERGKGPWANVYYNASGTKSGNSNKSVQGYVHIDHLMPIDSLKHISAKHRTQQQRELVIQNDSIKVVIRTIPFNASRHKITRADGFVQKIDGREPEGVDGELPTVELAAIDLTINGVHVTIPAKEYSDLYEPALETFNVFFGKDGAIYLYMPENSDGAGSYSAAWIIRKGQYIKRYVDTE